jgi:CHC2-type zinc finger protein
MSDIDEAKRRLPLPELMNQLGLGNHAKKTVRCPFHDDQCNSFSVWERNNIWFFKCHAGCGQGDEISFLQLFRQLSRSESTKQYLQMAGLNGAADGGRKNAGQPGSKHFDWDECVTAFTDEHETRLAEERGFSREFCSWLKKARLIGLYQGCLALPVHDAIGNVIGAHYRTGTAASGRKTWLYTKGSGVHLLIIGNLPAAKNVHIFESQWDGFAVWDRLQLCESTSDVLIITRGAGNGALVKDLISPDLKVFVWKQNDHEKNGIRAADKWLNAVVVAINMTANCVSTPVAFKDPNEWIQKGGASGDDLRDAIEHAEPITCTREADLEQSRAMSFGGQESFVVLPSGNVTITESATALFKIIAPTHRMFTRGKVVVSLCRTINVAAVLDPLRPSGARSFFESFAKFFAWRTGKDGGLVLKPSIIPEEIARAFLDCQAASDLLPSVSGLLNCPFIAEVNGALKVHGKGFDPDTGILVQQGDLPPVVPLAEAVAALHDLLSGFWFQSESDKARALAALITPALKMGNLIKGCVPADVAEADQSQSGKTYRQKIIAAIYGEEPALVPLKKGGVGSTDESLFEKFVNGRPFIQFDNYRGMLDSPALEAFLTASGPFPCRVAYSREIEVDPSRLFILMTSNGIETTRDLANRSSIVRIFKRSNTDFPDTLGNVRAQQSFFLGCVFAIVRAWHEAGKPQTSETRHDFLEWAQKLDWIVQHILDRAPLMDGHVAAQERVSNPALTFLRRIALEADRTDDLDVALTASQIFELAEAADIQVPGLRDEDRHNDEKGKRIIGIKMANAFKQRETIELDGFTATRKEENRTRANGAGGSYSIKTYTFKRVTQ